LSSLTWLDYSEHERRQAMEIVDLLGEDDTRDELGLGTIRDALADLLFPGTSTIQTRARYFLFVPWTCLELERRKITSAAAADYGRVLQGKLCGALRAGGETEGVIGFRAGVNVRRLPSETYWSGLRRWDVSRFAGSEPDYRRSLDTFYRRSDPNSFADEPESPERPVSNWDARLPKTAEGWLAKSTFDLTAAEADYLLHRIRQTADTSLLAHLLDSRQIVPDDARFPWSMDFDRPLDPRLSEQLEHARNFSDLMHGAALLYNLLLAREKPGEEYVEFYVDQLSQWHDLLIARRSELQSWDQPGFWHLILHDLSARVRPGTKLFVDRWIEMATSGAEFQESASAAALVRTQEHAVKPGRARLGDPRAVENWGGAAGAAPLDYRWRRPVRAMVNDILGGLARA
jgi:hypothetical protein